jgi:hypothetical protein
MLQKLKFYIDGAWVEVQSRDLDRARSVGNRIRAGRV